ncbi:MAG: hypothetical protein HDT26_07075 [Subdoligranulum sp.]|nr:hypothetical protein [Subdoligranulum sp.]
MEEFSLVYIDDTPDTILGRYLDNLNLIYAEKGYVIKYSEILFKSEVGYNSLLQDERVQTANILIIDSMLFENKTAKDGKFTGEEFKFVLQKFYPFIEVIVISQNDLDTGISMISKYAKNPLENGHEYYARIIPPCIDTAIDNILQYRILAKKMSDNESWETVLKEKVLGTLCGTQAYDELTKKDIDILIHAFKEIRDSINVS